MIARIPPTVRPPTLEEISNANPGWKVEREADGSITMSPTGSVARTTWSDGVAPEGFPTDFTSVFDAGME